eukprot:CAMPEP_0202485968 /NCGR_PEP_ID=MMETSP1361-20130828/4654_1 /ASSEMBLY_ACC=CAM_ASM_000849 /TAXON_ID=210615 /ORGANISM="Staurosira complex sp., Strain CCMP2646" /LENGTH=138 /DNA_ID=CAMNT_0049114971 /DNA_START=51 /DNA_END=467 /DNA_ORIENTATION=+
MVLFGPAPVINAVASIIKASRQSANLMADSLFKEEQRAEKERAFLFVGGPITTVTKLNKYTNNECIESNGIKVTTNATYKDVNNQLRSAIADIDSIEAIVEAMTIHSASSDQQRGLLALLCILKENTEKLVLEIDIFS